MTASVMCGRCGAPNSQDAQFCDACGAFMAAYQAPAGAMGTIEALTRPAEAVPASETVYSPPPRQTPEQEQIIVESEPVIEVLSEPVVPIEVPIELDTAKVEESCVAASLTELEPEPSPVALSADQMHFPAGPVKYTYTYTHPPAPPLLPSQEERPPAPEIFQKIFGDHADDVFYSNSGRGSGLVRGSPQSLILAGIAALIFVCFASAVAESNGWVFMLIGGPLAFTLIALGVLLLLGRYPTGRP